VEFIELLPSDIWLELEKNLHEEFEANHFHAYCENLRNTEPGISTAAAIERYRQLSPGEDRPVLPEDPFDRMLIPGCADGDWPPWPVQEMLTFIPKSICAKYGRAQESVLNGPFLELDLKFKSEIVRDLRDAGYHVERNDVLIRIVNGHGAECSEQDWHEVALLVFSPRELPASFRMKGKDGCLHERS
jgi:hypothetical protein